ncbi:hypothetical protein PFAG_04210 [Plasmodium falciparum Santa Lucia]|uniref:Plasmodium RESA N-terminal domain-containing protein n=7 Tax=Plasmodium falciparum TaxID=5833 RepID=Q8I4Q5_PLAF7|nr:Plasmodium exported protein (PHISTa), unknown function [Plasmodium falciparum 3D7]EUT82028.1 hypothetical protein PFAG_04210 [Plasmodium falciparum Santa Lucia]EWC75050.1 hypothetical protein C923_04279 [Plasmodium falciparum UGT5.1]KAF4327249.1 hypothetical protein CYL21_4733 [Plasmodium falciparum NF54]KOB62529.1 hypothetical protein PFHG_04247 [Plasmodium falciparum HB3]PKC48603.1 hypothetical protein CK202_2046 [Plasmodium falciparum NF54]|eukprot:XP_001350913.1 Plasmodium exported protein (PHISTa), unknown function [Plasmodium falciparum 3D7]
MKNIINKKFDSISEYIYMNKNGMLFYRSYLFFLTWYFIGIFYISLKCTYQNKGEEKIQYDCIYSRNLCEIKKGGFESFLNKICKYKLWNKKDDLNKKKIKKKKNKENNEDSKEQNINKNKDSCNNVTDANSMKKEDSIKVHNNNFISKQLTKEELYDLLYTLVEVPERKILLLLWNQTIGLYNEQLEDLLKEIYNFLPNRVYRNQKNSEGRSFYKIISREKIFDECVTNCREELAIKKVELTKGYYDLLNTKKKMDDIRNFIFSCIEQFEKLINNFCNKYKKDTLSLK